MFRKNGILRQSTLLSDFSEYGVLHGFSSREGGVSTLPHTYSLNLARNLGDNDETVEQNIDIFARAVSNGICGKDRAVITSQIHSAKVRLIDEKNAGEGAVIPVGEACDGFVTDIPYVMPIVRTADCVPILLCGTKESSEPVVAAVHAGWRGTVNGIAAEAVRLMLSLGCRKGSIAAAIGPHIRFCCYEVGDDFFESVKALCGYDFAMRHIKPSQDGRLHADLSTMNLEILSDCGVTGDRCDISDNCTACDPEVFYSHRASHGKRGTMGAGIVIVKSEI